MDSEEKQDGMLMKCNGTVGLHPSRILGFLGMDRARGSMGLSELALNGRSLAHHALLAEEEEEEDGLVERSALSQGLVPLEELMVHQDTERNSTEEEVEQHSLLPYRLPNPFHLPGNIKQEINLSDAVMQMKKEGRPAKQLSDFQKRKRKQRPPAKILTVNEDGSLGLQSPRSHVCEHCSAAFRTNYHLQRHAFIHTGEKPFQCSQCDMRFIQKYLLQRHEKIHTGEKPFRCDECGMRFIQKYHMERHKRTHSGEKPYQCSHCQQFFSRTDRVLKHKRMCHENRNRNPDKATAKDGTVVSENGLVFSCPPKDSSPMKKKRQKAGEKPRHLANPPDNTGVGEGKEDQRLNRNECLSLYSLASKVKHEYPVDEYSVELPDSRVCGSGPTGMNLTEEVHPPKLFLKKVSKKSQRQLTDQQDDLSPLSSFDDGKVSRYTFEHVGKPDMDAVGPIQGAPSKPAASSTNYDDAMQFLKKRRYLQAAVSTSGRDYALNMGMITTPNAVPQATGASIRNDAIPASILNAQTLKTEVKSSHEKNILPDEVLQTLLDHYSNKTNGQPEISFSVANTEVTSRMPINSSDMSAVTQGVTQGISSHVPPIEKASMLQEYSKFLQQALERTSQNDTYLNTQGLTFVTESQPLLNQPLFTTVDKLSTPSSRLQSGMSSPLRSSSEKSHFGLLVGDSQHSFSFSGDDTNPSSISPTEGFLEQVTAQKKTDNQVINPPFQIGTFEQNFQSQFQSSRSGTSSQFSFVSGAVTLQGHEDAKDFTEFPIASVTDTRTQMTSSPDSTASQPFS